MIKRTPTRPVPIGTIAAPGTQKRTLLEQADAAPSGDHRGDTSAEELRSYLRANPRIAALFPSVDTLITEIETRGASRVADPAAYVAQRTVSADQAARMIKSGDTVAVPVAHMIPTVVMKALLDRAKDPKELTGAPVKVYGGALFVDPALYETKKFVPRSVYLDAASRAAFRKRQGEFVPLHLHQVSAVIRSGAQPLNVAVVSVSPPDSEGMVSLGTTAVFSPDAVDRAKTVIAVINENVPVTNGVTRIPVEKIHYFVKSNDAIKALPEPEVTEVEARIAEHIVGMIPPGATLQFGIGGMPNAVAKKIAEKGMKGLKIYSEMISDGVMLLEQAGALDKAVPIRTSFMMGSQKCLDWMNKNDRVVMLDVADTNDYEAIRRTDNFVAINAALDVDLCGQVNAQEINGETYSGPGGQPSIMHAAKDSDGGLAIIALAATRTITGPDGTPKVISNIRPKLTDKDFVTTSALDVSAVVTEYGVAYLHNKSSIERAEALAMIAAPEFRAELLAEVEKLKGRKQRS